MSQALYPFRIDLCWLAERNYRMQAMDEGQHERFLENRETRLPRCRPGVENFAEVANKFFSEGSGQKTLSSPHNRQRLTFIAGAVPANFTLFYWLS